MQRYSWGSSDSSALLSEHSVATRLGASSVSGSQSPQKPFWRWRLRRRISKVRSKLTILCALFLTLRDSPLGYPMY
eukprot:4456626-Pleurochrysis_carterae.AAC.3